MSEATTPEAGVASQEAAPISTKEGAIEHISKLLDREDTPAPVSNEAAATTPSPEGESDAETEESGVEAQETQDTPEPARPSTWRELAERMGANPAELAADLVVEIKDGDKVSVAELVRGHLRGADYTQKTQQLAEKAKGQDQLLQQASAVWQQKLQEAGALVQFLETQMQGPSQGDLDALLETNPTEYLKMAEKQKRMREALDGVKNALRQNFERQTLEAQQKRETYRSDQQKLLRQKVEDYQDPKMALEFEQGMFKYLGEVGYSSDEVDTFTKSPFDHRDVLIIRDAMKYRQMQAGKGKVERAIKDKPPVLKPGPGKSKSSEQETIESSRQRIRNAPSDGTRREAALRYIGKII